MRLSGSVKDVLYSYGISSFDFSGETAEEVYEKMNLRGSEKPNKEEFLSKVEIRMNHYLLESVRAKRNELLTESDWTQSRDIMLWNDVAWKDYRQALRDLPKHVDITNPVYPSKPRDYLKDVPKEYQEEYEKFLKDGNKM